MFVSCLLGVRTVVFLKYRDIIVSGNSHYCFTQLCMMAGTIVPTAVHMSLNPCGFSLIYCS
jgi:hypothetical protein